MKTIKEGRILVNRTRPSIGIDSKGTNKKLGNRFKKTEGKK